MIYRFVLTGSQKPHRDDCELLYHFCVAIVVCRDNNSEINFLLLDTLSST